MPALEDEFGDILRKAREGAGLTVEQLAAATGIESEALLAMERYQREPSRDETTALADRLSLDAEALWTIAEGRYAPRISRWPQELEILTFAFPAMNSNGYLARHTPTGATFLVDPGGEPEAILEALEERDWSLSAILLTHGHADHLAGLDEVLGRVQVPVVAHPREWSGPGHRPVEGDAELTFGGSTVEVLFTPGHTEGGLTFCFSGVAFVGDTLFAGSLGRALRGQEWYPRLLASARRLVELPSETLLLPGHGPPTTAGEERANNPFLAKGERPR